MSSAAFTSTTSRSLICPLSHEIFTDPVVTPYGHTFERSAIEAWLSRSQTCPITRSPLSVDDLTPNRTVLEIVEARRQARLAPVAVLRDPADEPAGVASENGQPRAADALVPSVEVAPFVRDGNLARSVVSVKMPEGEKRSPVHVVCVCDVSGSMSTPADIQTAGGARESTGLSVLCIVKHAVKTILHMLGEGDMFSLVEFSNSARVLLQYSDVGGPGARREAIKLVEGMSARGGTNLYDGLMRGIKLADNVIDTSGDAGIPGWEEALPAAVGMSSAVFLLTDGVPNISPPRGIVQMLDRYVKRRGLDCSVVTFGFGYNLDSHLLHEIAVRGGGQFNFIPDSQLLGTVFVHAISNLLSTGCKKVSLRLELGEEAARRGVVLDNDSVSQAYKGITSGGSEVRVELGTVQLGQSRDIPVSVSMGGSEGVTGPDREPLVRAVVEYTTLGGSRGAAECSGLLWESEGEEEAGVNNSSERLKEFRCRHRSRLLVVDCLSEVVRRRPEMFDHAGSAVSELVASLSELASNHGCDNALSSSCLGLKEDVEGEVWTAVSRKDWFTRWGVHYLTSLSRAHLLQLCCNFKDPGLQSYGGRLFDKLRDEADEVFLGLPLLSVAETNGGGGQMPYPTGFGTGMSWSMSYHNSADPCVSADARIRMADGSLKKAGEIVKGDVVETRVAGGAVRASAAVACVLETVPGKSGVLTPPMVEVGGGVDGARAARVTAWHPVRAGDGAAWQFPAAVGRVLRRAERGLFSFVLEEGVCVVMEGGVQAVTLGHGMEGPVVGHRYLGTCRVVRDLMGFGGWETGRVVVESGGMRREGQRICGFGEEVEVVVAARVGQCHRAILAECRN